MNLSLDNLKINLADIRLNFNNLVKLEILALILINIVVFLMLSNLIGGTIKSKNDKILSIKENITLKESLTPEEKDKEKKRLEEVIGLRKNIYSVLQKRVELINKNVTLQKDASQIVDKIVKLPYSKERINVESVSMVGGGSSDGIAIEGSSAFLGEYQQQNIKIELNATYKDLIEFLAKLKILDFPVYLESLEISVSEYPKLQITLSLATLIKGESTSGGGFMPMGAPAPSR